MRHLLAVAAFVLAAWALATVLRRGVPWRTRVLWVPLIVALPLLGPGLWLRYRRRHRNTTEGAA